MKERFPEPEEVRVVCRHFGAWVKEGDEMSSIPHTTKGALSGGPGGSHVNL